MKKLRKSLFLIVVIIIPFIINVLITETKGNFYHSEEKINVSTLSQASLRNKEAIYSNDNFSDQQLFWISLENWVQLRATLLAEGNFCYIYMANETIELLGENNSIVKCEAIRDAFDADIYPKALEIAGHPDGKLGDCDGDPKITVFLAPLVRHIGSAYLGYYQPEQEILGYQYANVREMIYVDSEMSVYDTICITIHEFDHLIWFNNDLNDCEFINEGLANYAIDYTGYYSWVTDAVTKTFTNHPEISLLFFNRIYNELWDASYGQAYLFVTYLAERFGNNFTRKLVSIPEDGAIGVDIALDYFNLDLTFNDLYLDWITACVLDDPSFAGGIYGFSTVNYKIIPATSVIFDFPRSRTHYYYGFDVKKIYTPIDNFTFIIDNPYPYALGVSYVLENDSGIEVVQDLYWEDSDELRINIVGENLDEVTIITSLMSKDSPTEYGTVMSMSEIDSAVLHYKIIKENPIETSSAKLFYMYLFYLPIIMYVCKKMKKNLSNKNK